MKPSLLALCPASPRSKPLEEQNESVENLGYLPALENGFVTLHPFQRFL